MAVNKGLKKIPVRQLLVGMYVHEFCGSWMEHPFWRSRFLLNSEADLARVVQSGIKELWIDRSGREAIRGRGALEKLYGEEQGKRAKYAETFEICEYGRRPSPEEIKKLFPFYGE